MATPDTAPTPTPTPTPTPAPKSVPSELLQLLRSRTLPNHMARELHQLITSEKVDVPEPVLRVLAHRTWPDVEHEYKMPPHPTTGELPNDNQQYSDGTYFWSLGLQWSVNTKKTPTLEETLRQETPMAPYKLGESFMGTKMQAGPPLSQVLTAPRMKMVANVLRDEVSITSEAQLVEVVERMRTQLGAGEPTGFRERKRKHKRPKKRGLMDKKNTFTATYKVRNKAERATLPDHLRGYKAYTRGLQILGILEGRLRNMFDPLLKTTCARLDKSGLTTFCVTEDDLNDDMATSVWLVQQVAELSVRKEFTLDKQQQGGLNVHQQWIMDNILAKSLTTRWDLIAYVYPTADVLARCDMDQLRRMQTMWMTYLPLMAKFLRAQWTKGVDRCCERNMMVPSSRASTGIDSTGWNNVSGSWNNAVRQVRGVWNALDQTDPDAGVGVSQRIPLFKCLKLTAGDQMQWAEGTGKGVDPDTAIFQTLAKNGVLPWKALSGELTTEVITQAVTQACDGFKVPPAKWLGPPRGWKSDTKHHGDMICGVSVSCTKETADLLKSIGVFGSSPAPILPKDASV